MSAPVQRINRMKKEGEESILQNTVLTESNCELSVLLVEEIDQHITHKMTRPLLHIIVSYSPLSCARLTRNYHDPGWGATRIYSLGGISLVTAPITIHQLLQNRKCIEALYLANYKGRGKWTLHSDNTLCLTPWSERSKTSTYFRIKFDVG